MRRKLASARRAASLSAAPRARAPPPAPARAARRRRSREKLRENSVLCALTLSSVYRLSTYDYSLVLWLYRCTYTNVTRVAAGIDPSPTTQSTPAVFDT
jgi:hypothetical protein